MRKIKSFRAQNSGSLERILNLWLETDAVNFIIYRISFVITSKDTYRAFVFYEEVRVYQIEDAVEASQK